MLYINNINVINENVNINLQFILIFLSIIIRFSFINIKHPLAL